ncbi:MAG: tRNA pseudouridine(55) synthase TruB [Candidatus Omnitrophica bacterium]|nr:tRNA pseudouridine(55) synthase TruB [Candidatus Omnitrophota bacterium]
MDDNFLGILIVDKKKGMTSHDVVSLIRRRFGVKKVGHAGTLDPNATGVLVLLLGGATKLSGNFLNEDKEYEAVMKLGVRTASGDPDAEIISEKEVNVGDAEIRKAVNSFVGEIEQMPPMFSAKKVQGKKLYQFARKGIEVEREPKKVTIKNIEITEIIMPLVKFKVVCGKGTYIRQLVDDIGEALVCGAHLQDLRRTRSGNFHIKDAVEVDKLLAMDRKAVETLAKLWSVASH